MALKPFLFRLRDDVLSLVIEGTKGKKAWLFILVSDVAHFYLISENSICSPKVRILTQ